jgi:hypothetical protein
MRRLEVIHLLIAGCAATGSLSLFLDGKLRTSAMLPAISSRGGVQFERSQVCSRTRPESGYRPSGAKVAWFKDPNGNILWIAQA